MSFEENVVQTFARQVVKRIFAGGRDGGNLQPRTVSHEPSRKGCLDFLVRRSHFGVGGDHRRENGGDTDKSPPDDPRAASYDESSQHIP